MRMKRIVGLLACLLLLGLPSGTPGGTGSTQAAPALFALRINAGGPEYGGSQLWSADQLWTGSGYGHEGGDTYTNAGAIENTTNDPVYQTQRNGAFTYRATVPNGIYRVTLNLAETFATTVGSRLFDVRGEGQLLWDDLDILKTAGARFRALDLTAGLAVCDGTLDLQFLSIAGKGSPTVGGIEIDQVYAPGDTTWHFNAGGGAYTDGSGITWQADSNYCAGLGGYIIPPSSGILETYGVQASQEIANTTDDPLYRDERHANPFEYRFDLPNGRYRVDLRFAELFYTSFDRRIFHIELEGVRVASNFDPYLLAGGRFRALDRSYIATVSDGQLNVILVPVKGYPSVSALSVRPDGSTPTPTTTATPSLTPSPSATPPLNATATATPSPSATATAASGPPGHLAGTVFEDQDRDGQRGRWEPLLAGATLRLREGSCGGPQIRVATSDGATGYRFDNLTPGLYCVQEENPPGYPLSTTPFNAFAVQVYAGTTTLVPPFGDATEPTPTPTGTWTAPSATPTWTNTPGPSATPTMTPSATPSPTATATQTATASATATATPTTTATATPPACPVGGDADGDGTVEADDILVFAAAFRQANQPLDISGGDGRVTLADVMLAAARFGQRCQP